MATNRGGSIAPNFLKGFLSENLVISNRCTAVLSIANTDNKHGRFDSTKFSEGLSLENLVLSNRCAAVLSIANTDNKQGRFDSTKVSEGLSFRKLGAIEPLLCYPLQILKTKRGGSIALIILEGCLS